MKKRIALLLAAVMILAVAIPTQLFAASTNTITKTYVNASEGDLISNNSQNNYSYEPSASYATFRINNDVVNHNQSFIATLNNGAWSFYNEIAEYQGLTWDFTNYAGYDYWAGELDGSPANKTYDQDKGVAIPLTISGQTVMAYTNVKEFNINVTVGGITTPTRFSTETTISGITPEDAMMALFNYSKTAGGSLTTLIHETNLDTFTTTTTGTAANVGEVVLYDSYKEWNSSTSAVAKDTLLDPTAAQSNVPFILVTDGGADASVTVLNAPKVQVTLAPSYTVHYPLLSLPLVFSLTADDEVTLKTVQTSPNSDLSNFNGATIVTQRGDATIAFESLVTSRDAFNLSRAYVQERTVGTLRDGTIYLIAPDGYVFANKSNLSDISVYPDIMSGITQATKINGRILPAGYMSVYASSAWSNAMEYEFGKVMVIEIDFEQSKVLPGKFYIEGLKLVVSEEDNSAVIGEKASVTFGNNASHMFGTSETANHRLAGVYGDATNPLFGFGSGNTPINPSKEDSIGIGVRVAEAIERVDYGINFSVADNKVTEFYAGAEYAKLATVTFAETAYLSLTNIANGVRFELVDKDGNSLDGSVKILTGTGATFDPAGAKSTYSTTGITDASLKFYDSYFVLRGDRVNANAKGSAKITLFLTAAADFEGEVYLHVADRVLYNANPDRPADLHIATVKAPVIVETVKSTIQVGYQSIAVQDITIKEPEAKLWKVSGDITLAMQSFGQFFSDIAFANARAITVAQVKGDGLISKLSGNAVAQSYTPTLNLKVSRVSAKEAFEIKISGINMYADRSVPEGYYDFAVGGNAFVHNYVPLTYSGTTVTGAPRANVDKWFNVFGVVKEEYIVVGTPGLGKALSRNVAVSLEEPTVAIVDNVDFDISAAPCYIDPATNRTMMSIKYIAMALGIAESEVKWDGVTRTVTIYTNLRGTVTRFYIGEHYYTINGGVQHMVDDNGVFAYSVINNERSYVPMKYLAEAFGIDVIWNSQTKTAYFNPTAAQIAECTLANTEVEAPDAGEEVEETEETPEE